MNDWHGNETRPDGKVRVVYRDGRTAEGNATWFMWNHDPRDRMNDVVGWERAR
jgi:hypothetical protein